MYNWYAWIELWDREASWDDKAGLERKLADLRAGAANLGLRITPPDPVTSMNGTRLFLAAGSRNHRGSSHELLLEFLRRLARDLPWSRGLVHWYDDEDPQQPAGLAYRVLVVMRGQVVERLDPFLSSLIPNTEEPDTPGDGDGGGHPACL